MALNARQARFAVECCIDLNATQAAIRAGYSENTAGSQGHDLLKNPEIQARIKRHEEDIAAKAEITAERVLREMARLAFFDARKLLDDAGAPVPISQLDDDTAAAIAGIDVVTQGNQDVGFAEIQKIKIADKRQSLDSLARYLKLFTDRQEVAVTGLGDILASVAGNTSLPVGGANDESEDE